MKIFLLSTILVIITYGSLKSQKIEGFLYHAVYIPSEISNKINVDGNITEWNWVPEDYKIRTSDLINSEQVTSNDLDVEFFVAWSKLYNKIYIICRVIDDFLSACRFPQNLSEAGVPLR